MQPLFLELPLPPPPPQKEEIEGTETPRGVIVLHLGDEEDTDTP